MLFQDFYITIWFWSLVFRDLRELLMFLFVCLRRCQNISYYQTFMYLKFYGFLLDFFSKIRTILSIIVPWKSSRTAVIHPISTVAFCKDFVELSSRNASKGFPSIAHKVSEVFFFFGVSPALNLKKFSWDSYQDLYRLYWFLSGNFSDIVAESLLEFLSGFL